MVKRVKSEGEAWDILHRHCWLVGTEIAVSLDSESRVDVTGHIRFRCKGQKEFPLWFGKVTGNFIANWLALGKLEGAPYWVGNDFSVQNNRLTSTFGGPEHVGRHYKLLGNNLQNLDGLATHIGDSVSLYYHKNLPLLRTLVAKRIWPHPDQPALEKILVKYAGKGKRAMFDCQKELEDAGFGENARW